MRDHWLLLHLKNILKNQFPSQTVLQKVLLHNGLKVNALLFFTAGTKQVNKTYSFAMIPKKVFVSLYSHNIPQGVTGHAKVYHS